MCHYTENIKMTDNTCFGRWLASPSIQAILILRHESVMHNQSPCCKGNLVADVEIRQETCNVNTT